MNARHASPKIATRPRRPHRFTAAELKRAGVTILNPSNLLLACDQCGCGWSPNLVTGGKLPRGYWKCPNGCNDDAA